MTIAPRIQKGPNLEVLTNSLALANRRISLETLSIEEKITAREIRVELLTIPSTATVSNWSYWDGASEIQLPGVSYWDGVNEISGDLRPQGY